MLWHSRWKALQHYRWCYCTKGRCKFCQSFMIHIPVIQFYSSLLAFALTILNKRNTIVKTKDIFLSVPLTHISEAFHVQMFVPAQRWFALVTRWLADLHNLSSFTSCNLHSSFFPPEFREKEENSLSLKEGHKTWNAQKEGSRRSKAICTQRFPSLPSSFVSRLFAFW